MRIIATFFELFRCGREAARGVAPAPMAGYAHTGRCRGAGLSDGPRAVPSHADTGAPAELRPPPAPTQ